MIQFLLTRVIKKIREIGLNEEILKNALFIITLILLFFFYFKAGYYKSIINRLENERKSALLELQQVDEFNKIINNYLKESLDEDIYLSSNDIFHLRRSIGMSNDTKPSTSLFSE